MNTESLVETLRDAGLSPYQAEAYVTLLGRGSLSAQELAKASSVPAPRIYDVLDALEAEGYVVTYERDQLYAEALDPEEGLQSLVARVDQFEEAIDEINTRWVQPSPDSIDIGVVKQFQTVLARTKERIVDADHQILLALTPDNYHEVESVLRSAYRRGVSVQVALHSSAAFTPSDGLFEGVCSEVRFGTTPCMYEPFLAIIDGHDVCFAPFSRDTTRDRFGDSSASLEPQYGVVVVDPVTAYVYEWYFLAALWEPSDRIFSARSDRPPIEFVDVRELIRAVDPLLREDTVVTVTVEGRRVSSGRHDRFSGRITSVRTDTSESPNGEPTRSLLTREAEIVVETEDSTVTVGGKGAVNEDVEAARVIITDIAERTE